MIENNYSFSDSNSDLHGQSIFSGDLQGYIGKVCPHLKHVGDSDTIIGFPSEFNHCFKIKPSAAPQNEHQREYCLAENYLDCPVFLFEKYDKETKNGIFQKKGSRKAISLVFILVIGVVVSLILISINPFKFSKTSLISNRPSETQLLSADSGQLITTPDYSLTQISIPTTTITFTPNPPTSTPTTIPPRLLGTPIGQDTPYLIHKVVEGDSLIYLSSMYSTTVDAIMAANDPLMLPIFIDSYLVIPYRHSDLSKIIPLTAFKVVFEDNSVSYIADRFKVEPDVIADVNAVPLDHIFTVGGWMLLPKTSE